LAKAVLAVLLSRNMGPKSRTAWLSRISILFGVRDYISYANASIISGILPPRASIDHSLSNLSEKNG